MYILTKFYCKYNTTKTTCVERVEATKQTPLFLLPFGEMDRGARSRCSRAVIGSDARVETFRCVFHRGLWWRAVF